MTGSVSAEVENDAAVAEMHGTGEANDTGEAEDTVDPLTGIPSRWAELWRATKRNASIGAGLPDPVRPPSGVGDTLSDVAPAAAAVASSTENQTTTSTDGKRQLNLKAWLE